MKLPKIDIKELPPPRMSMEQYLDFIQDMLADIEPERLRRQRELDDKQSIPWNKFRAPGL